MKLQEAILRLEGCHNIPMLFSVSSDLAEIYAGNDVVLDFLKDKACEILEGFDEDYMTQEQLERGRFAVFNRKVFTNGPLPEA